MPIRYLNRVLITVSIVVALALLAAIALRMPDMRGWFHSETTLNANLPTVVEQVKDLSRLEPAELDAEKIVEGTTQTHPLPVWLVGDHVLLVAHGVVTAGIDLSGFSENDVRVDGEVVHVRLPASHVFSVRLDDRSFVYDHHPGILGGADPNLESEARARAEQEIRAAAISAGLLARADKSARSTVERLFEAAGFHQVVFDR